MGELIKMIRSEEDAKGGPRTADVHPDEVQNYRLGGWVSDAEQKPKEDGRKKKPAGD